MKYFDTFAGVGGFSLGIERAYASLLPETSENRGGEKSPSGSESGHDAVESDGLRSTDGWMHRDTDRSAEGQPHPVCVGFSEIDKYASAVLRHNYPNVKNYGSITEIDWSEVPDFDLLTGGSPCQDFSIAGKRAGLEGSRSGLFREYLRCLREKQPQYFIWENVKGVLSSRSGWDFANIQVALAEAGYSLWWQVLNAKDFGVPQNRERVFVFGTRNGSPREVFFEREADKPHQESANCIDANYHKGWLDHGQRTMIDVSRTIRVGGQKSPHGFKQNRDSYEIEGRIRRLTPTECERLMGWPDGWTALGRYSCEEEGKKRPKDCKLDTESLSCVHPISDTQRYKMCGNGVVANCVEAIVKAHLL